ncbi:MAG: peptide chain release factor N(5)-glutamine methyltransferase [Endomicrobium sp.]|jgi:release factor glutamine methyltransferase|nr:peptide chain release factor N(5)-glutamine methyltransferase [Endomicrobium sp.]
MINGENVYTLLKSAEIFLKSKGFVEAKVDSEVLLSFVLQVKRSQLWIISGQRPTDEQISQYRKYLLRRVQREPVAYIVGFSGFMGFEFKISKKVLIPRPETELLVEVVSKLAKEENKNSVLDLGTGSGCIAISLAKLGAFKSIAALDISIGALGIAKENATRNNVSCIDFIESDVFHNISSNSKFDIIVSNPPYVSQQEYRFLEPELKYEPKIALVAQDDGLFFYKEICRNASVYLNNGGFVVVELNANKADAIKRMFLDTGYKNIEIMNDYSELPRILRANI